MTPLSSAGYGMTDVLEIVINHDTDTHHNKRGNTSGLKPWRKTDAAVAMGTPNSIPESPVLLLSYFLGL